MLTNKHTNKQTSLKTSNAFRYAMALGKNKQTNKYANTHNLILQKSYSIPHEIRINYCSSNHNAVVTCEIKLFQNYFSIRRRPSEIILAEIISKWFQRLLQLMNAFQRVQRRWNNFAIISVFYFTIKWCNHGIMHEVTYSKEHRL